MPALPQKNPAGRNGLPFLLFFAVQDGAEFFINQHGYYGNNAAFHQVHGRYGK